MRLYTRGLCWGAKWTERLPIRFEWLAPWDPAEYLVDSFRRRRQTVLQNHFACLIQNAVMASWVSQIQTDGQLGLLSLVLRARRLLGAYRIPRRPAFSLENIDEKQLVRRL
jgi:hypothetical protein